MSMPASPAEDFRWSALRAAFWIGWLSIAAVLLPAVAGDASDRRREVVGLTVGAAVVHALVMAAPWRRWLGVPRGEALLDAWSAGLLIFVSSLILIAGGNADYDLLLFLVLPFLATIHEGKRRIVWISAGAGVPLGACLLARDPLPEGVMAMRVVLLGAAVVLSLALSAATRKQAAARAAAAARADLEGVLLAEAHHRVKNSLQSVADLLLLARPAGSGADPFEHTAGRIRNIARVHELLAVTRGDVIRVDEVMRAVTAGLSQLVSVHADAAVLPIADAQRLGMVANELVQNAIEHGIAPIVLTLRSGDTLCLEIRDAGRARETPDGLGLRLVRQLVEQGLHGSFTLESDEGHGTVARVVLPPKP